MNEIIQRNEVVHIIVPKLKRTPSADQEMAITMLSHILDINYTDAKLIVNRDKYNEITSINIQFNDVEDATHFKLFHSWSL